MVGSIIYVRERLLNNHSTTLVYQVKEHTEEVQRQLQFAPLNIDFGIEEARLTQLNSELGRAEEQIEISSSVVELR